MHQAHNDVAGSDRPERFTMKCAIAAILLLIAAASASAQQIYTVDTLPASLIAECDAPGGIDLTTYGFTLAVDGGTPTVPPQRTCFFPFQVTTEGTHLIEVRGVIGANTSAPVPVSFAVKKSVVIIVLPPTNVRITPKGVSASVSGTTIPPATSITANDGHVWTLGGTTGTDVQVDGQKEPTAGPCTKIGYFSGKVYVFADQWYRWSGLGAPWVPVGSATPQD